MVEVKDLAMAAVGFLLFAVLGAVALEQMESYVPTDPILLIVWPIAGVLFVVGVALSFLRKD
jgi:hypothetical protein